MKILAAVDPSLSALKAAEKAIELAKKEGAELTFMAVAEAFEDMESIFGAQATDKLREEAGKALDKAKEIAAKAGVKAKVVLQNGVAPEDLLVAKAEKGGFDLIVMGTRGKKGSKRLTIGSVASGVVALAPCSVLVVR